MALHEVNQHLSGEFPWLKTDPDPIMGDPRPRTLAELLKKDQPVWKQLYKEFVESRYPSYADGLAQMADGDKKLAEYRPQFEAAYGRFYTEAGELKDAVRKNPQSVPSRFPWAPPNPKSLLGDARPKTFAELLKEGPNSAWMGTFKAWCRVKPPFASADGWLDWVVGQSGGNAWARTLDPIVAAFADEIGRIKERMHQRNDSSASQFGRRVQQVGEAMADHWVDKANEIRGDTHGSGQAAPQPQAPKTPPTTTQGQHAQQKPPTTTTTTSQGQQKPPTTTTTSQGQQKPQTAPQKPQVKPDPVAAARKQLLTQLDVCDRLAPMGVDVAQTANQLGHKYAALGGVFAEEAACLYAYFQVVSDASRALQAQAVKSRSQSAAITTLGIFDALRDVRYAAYVLAWQIDLGYRTDAGKWPHDRIQAVLTAVDSSQCQALYQVAGQATSALCRSTWELYDKAREALDGAKVLVDHKTPGYDGQDGAVPWGVHEVMAAIDGVNTLYSYAMQFTGQPPGDEVDETARDEAAQSCFGITYDQLAAGVGTLV